MPVNCNLIIDSCCDLPFEEVDKEGIELVHLAYVLDGAITNDDMFHSSSAHDFYQSMRDGAEYSTSQVSAAELEGAFGRAVASGVPTVYLAFSSGISGSYEAGVLVQNQIKQEHPDAKIYVVDTLVGSTPEGLLVSEAIRQRDRGMTAEELVAWVEEARYFVQTMFMVDDLEALRRGGRIPAAAAAIGTKLDVKPLLSFDTSGRLSLVGIARGRRKGLRQMAEFFAKNHDTEALERFAGVGNADCPKDADRLCELLEHADSNVVVQKTSVGPTIGSHVGPDMVSVTFWGPDRRKSVSIADRIAQHVKAS